jgi:hypothetical protein
MYVFCYSYFLCLQHRKLGYFRKCGERVGKRSESQSSKSKSKFFFFTFHFFLNLCTLYLFGSSRSCIYRERVSQQPGDRRKRDQRRNCKRRWKPGQEACLPPPHHLVLSLWSVQRSQRWISIMASRSCVYKLILDSDGDHVFFSPFFCRSPVSRYIDCYS